MSRLLPENVKIGLFPGCCWLKRSGAAEPIIVLVEGQGAEVLQAAFGALLAQLSDAGPLNLHLLVSDSLAAVTLLPWQESLVTDPELRAYAQACFEQGGTVIDDGWVMQCGFRRFRSSGMAYALPHSWLSNVMTLSEVPRVRLKTALPISAMAYWRHSIASADGQSLLLLVERDRLTALTSANGSVVNRDVQPVLGNIDVSGVRLLKRVMASQRNIQTVFYCDSSSFGAASPQAFVAACLPDARIASVSAVEWI